MHAVPHRIPLRCCAPDSINCWTTNPSNRRAATGINFASHPTHPEERTKMKIQILKQAARRSDLADTGAVGRPLSQPACTTKTLPMEAALPGTDMGVWETTPGSYERQVANAELMHILTGRCTFTPEGGEPLAIEAGDTVFFPAHTRGRWDMLETLRKVFVVFPEA